MIQPYAGDMDSKDSREPAILSRSSSTSLAMRAGSTSKAAFTTGSKVEVMVKGLPGAPSVPQLWQSLHHNNYNTYKVALLPPAPFMGDQATSSYIGGKSTHSVLPLPLPLTLGLSPSRSYGKLA